MQECKNKRKENTSIDKSIELAKSRAKEAHDAMNQVSREVEKGISKNAKCVSHCQGLKLAFEENFDKPDLDLCVWERLKLSATTTDFLGIGCATDSVKNSYIEDGKLVLQAIEEEILGPDTYLREFPIDIELDTSNGGEVLTKRFIGHATTSQIQSKNPIVSYGYCEITAEIPVVDSMFTNIELIRFSVAKDEPTVMPYGRVGITTQQGTLNSDSTSNGLIYGGPAGITSSNQSGVFASQVIPNRTGSHRYGVEILPGVVRWWLDAEVVNGQVVGGTLLNEVTDDTYFTLNTTGQKSTVPNTPFDRPLFIRITLAPGGGDTLFIPSETYNFNFFGGGDPDINFGVFFPYQTYPYDTLPDAKLKVSSIKYYKTPGTCVPDFNIIRSDLQVCEQLCRIPCTDGKLKLCFEDNFCKSKLDHRKWISQALTGEGAGNEEPQIYTDVNLPGGEANTFIENHQLHLKAVPIEPPYTFPPGNVGDIEHIEYIATSAKVVSKETFHHGYVEVRAKVPATPYAFPAIWLFPWHNKYQLEQFNQLYALTPNSPFENWPRCGEIDIMEVAGAAGNPTSPAAGDVFSTNIITGGPDFWGITFPFQIVNSEDLGTTWEEYISGFHTYGLEWTPDYLRFYVDAEVICGKITGGTLLRAVDLQSLIYYDHLGRQYTGKEVYSQPLPLSMNVAFQLPGSFGGDSVWSEEYQGTSEVELPTEMIIDHVRAYKFPDLKLKKKCKKSKKCKKCNRHHHRN